MTDSSFLYNLCMAPTLYQFQTELCEMSVFHSTKRYLRTVISLDITYSFLYSEMQLSKLSIVTA
jgi:hypothetical protein